MAYESFAEVYDLFMDEVPYDEWSKNIISILNKNNIKDGLVADLGCGTGQITRRLAKAGYDMTGIDLSYEMLMKAMNIGSDVDDVKSENEILYLCQDMREFELYGTMAAIVSVCDSMNYLTSYDDLVQVLKLCNNYLDPKGIFVFDINTEYKYSELLSDNVIAENRDNASFIWENEYDVETKNNYYYLTIYVENEDGTYDRFEEEHIQHAFSVDEIKQAVVDAGMELVDILDVATMGEVQEDSERLYFVVRESGKSS